MSEGLPFIPVETSCQVHSEEAIVVVAEASEIVSECPNRRRDTLEVCEEEREREKRRQGWEGRAMTWARETIFKRKRADQRGRFADASVVCTRRNCMPRTAERSRKRMG